MELKSSSIVERLPTFVTESASFIAETTNYEMQILLYLFFGHQRPSHQFEKHQDIDEPKYEAESRLGALVAGVCGVIWSISEFGLDVVSVMRGQHIKNGLTRDPAEEEEEDDQDQDQDQDHDHDEGSGPYETQGSQNGLTLEIPKTKDSQPTVPPSGEPIPVEVVPTGGDPSSPSPKTRREKANAPISASASQRSISSMLSMQDPDSQQRMRVQGDNEEESHMIIADAETPTEIMIGGNGNASNRDTRPSIVVFDNNPQKTGGNENPISYADAASAKRTESDAQSDSTTEGGRSSSAEQDAGKGKKSKKRT